MILPQNHHQMLPNNGSVQINCHKEKKKQILVEAIYNKIVEYCTGKLYLEIVTYATTKEKKCITIINKARCNNSFSELIYLMLL